MYCKGNEETTFYFGLAPQKPSVRCQGGSVGGGGRVFVNTRLNIFAQQDLLYDFIFCVAYERASANASTCLCAVYACVSLNVCVQSPSLIGGNDRGKFKITTS